MNRTHSRTLPHLEKSCRRATRYRALFLSVAALALSSSAEAVVLIEAPGPLADFETRPNSPYAYPWGHVGPVVVGSQAVQINGIGVLGQTLLPTEISWVIFGNVDLSSPLYQSAPMSYSTSGVAQWYDSPTFSSPFTLQANTTYWIGFAVNSPNNSFRFFFNDTFPSNAPTVTANGLTMQGSPFPWAANLSGSFAVPVLTLGTSTAQLGLRLHGVPEPSAAVCLLPGALFMLRRRRPGRGG